jgi:cytochrome c peroxidase
VFQGGPGHDGDGTLLREPLEDAVEDQGAASVGSSISRCGDTLADASLQLQSPARQAQREIASGHLEAVDRAAIETDMSVLGRFLITNNEADTAAFKTPNLRNVLVTAPYFHDGSQETLWDVIDHYNKGDGLQNPWLDEDIQPLALTERDIDDLVAFLASLTSPDYRERGVQELERQRALSRTSRPQRDTKRAFGPKPPRLKSPQP